MRPRRTAPGLVLAAAALLLLGAERPPGLGDVRDVRHWSYASYTRIVVELTRHAEGQIRRLPADAAAGRPERLYLDLPGIWVGKRFGAPIRVDDGLLRGVRLGQYTLRTTRLVLDLDRYQRHRVLLLRNPERVVIDVFGPRSPIPDSGDAPLPVDVRGVGTVVLDPGHGGRDPGAIGAGGVREKDVTLDLSRRVKRRLEELGFRVVMTRDRDRSLSLEERTAVAAGSGGDVFVSIHANASRRRAVRGVETYYLDVSNERQSLRVAARENGVSPREFDALDRTLARLRVAENSDYSALLAKLVQHRVVGGVGRRYRDVEDLGVKRGPFYVLFLSSMPSILFEAGFLTNRSEAARLRNGAYLDRVADELARAISMYRDQVGTRVARGAP